MTSKNANVEWYKKKVKSNKQANKKWIKKD